eukprot:CAMPEP_0184486156 /NCGR_PEP_ID=MMETSP0113_2-20130426/7697_1 /TAXON_ID=91329 /ORGANISM="Norrisiella sphaerica, Strain BC52" /LENGTH=279 /DNA_ID=CAMNT_0026867901 /DNA_START=20 /DNA_END=859 /DNA_ORIENTATION=+
MKLVNSIKCFGGAVNKYVHKSGVTQCDMTFTVFLPSKAATQKVPSLYYLSGLTCTPENFITKAGAFAAAEREGIVLVAPDTSPRGVDIEGEDESYDFGSSAGFYMDATEPKWRKHYNMYSYITAELPELVREGLPVTDAASIFGHSMGGHGALTIYLKNPGTYRSVSAFSPICNPTDCPWGVKAFSGYLGEENKEAWESYDAVLLLNNYSGPKTEILVDQGLEDSFLDEQLKPERLAKACEKAGIPLNLRMQEGYDHSYFFISTFVDDHIAFHAKHLLA